MGLYSHGIEAQRALHTLSRKRHDTYLGLGGMRLGESAGLGGVGLGGYGEGLGGEEAGGYGLVEGGLNKYAQKMNNSDAYQNTMHCTNTIHINLHKSMD